MAVHYIRLLKQKMLAMYWASYEHRLVAWFSIYL